MLDILMYGFWGAVGVGFVATGVWVMVCWVKRRRE